MLAPSRVFFLERNRFRLLDFFRPPAKSSVIVRLSSHLQATDGDGDNELLRGRHSASLLSIKSTPAFEIVND